MVMRSLAVLTEDLSGLPRPDYNQGILSLFALRLVVHKAHAPKVG